VRALVLLCIAGCVGTFDVPTQRMPITWQPAPRRNGHWIKGGVPIEGRLCGRSYVDAVSGVPEAQARVADCRHWTIAYIATMSSSIALPFVGVGIDEATSHRGEGPYFIAGMTIGVIAFLSGFVEGWIADDARTDAIHIYNAAQ
jgi:hypothetical protein